MHLPSGWPWIAAVVLIVALRLLGISARILTGWAVKFVLGGVALWAIDIFGARVGVHLAVNPATSAAVGFLGVPGLLMVAGAHFILTGGIG